MLMLLISPTVSLSQQSLLKELVQIFLEEIGCLLFAWIGHKFILSSLQHLLSQCMLQKHSTVFHDEVGLMKTVKATICVKLDFRLCHASIFPSLSYLLYFRPCHISYFMQDKVNFKLDNLLSSSQMATLSKSVVVIYKVTVNHKAQVNSYPLPRIDDLFSKLVGSTVFSKMNLALHLPIYL